MKKCSYCGKRYSDEATQCAVDQQPLEQIAASSGSFPTVNQPGASRMAVNDPVRAAARRNLLLGGLWLGGGLVITLLTYGVASSSRTGGTYVVAWGAIVVGAVRIFRGLAAGAAAKASSPAPGPAGTGTNAGSGNAPAAAASDSPPPWTCSTCGEQQIAGQLTTCWKCGTPREETRIA